MLERIAEQVEHHQTTLVFVNTRRMAERLAHQLAERLGEEGVAAHHGSLSRNRRLRVETALREGRLRALVATASLELGIDVGPVELVCQIGSPRSLATFLAARRSLGPFSRRYAEGTALPADTGRAGRMCGTACAACAQGGSIGCFRQRRPLDILAQQIVAACAAEPWKEADLFALCARSAPYRGVDARNIRRGRRARFRGNRDRARSARGLSSIAIGSGDSFALGEARGWPR